MIEEVVVNVLVHNVTDKPLLLRIEPWAEEFLLPVGAKYRVEFTGQQKAEPEMEITPSEIVLYGWAGSVYSVYDENGKEKWQGKVIAPRGYPR